MELNPPDTLARDRADELAAVLSGSEDDAVRRDRRERMHVGERRGIGESFDERRRLLPGNRVPADLRDLEPWRVKCAHLAREQTESVGATQLHRALEQQLHAEADPEHRHALAVTLVDELVEPARADRLHRLRERPDTGQDEPGGRADPP